MTFYAGLDLGQVQDYSALAIVAVEPPQRPLPGEQPTEPAHLVRHLERFKLGTRYPEIVAGVKARLEAPDVWR